MEYNPLKKEIKLDRELSNLDKFVIDFIRILEKHIDYVIISGYISILLGRSRATEDVDVFIKKMDKIRFFNLYNELRENGFECINAESPEEVFSYINEGLAIRFSRKSPIPNFEVKFPKREVDEETFNDFLTVITPAGNINISSLERQIAFKRYYLKSKKDIEDAIHIEELFKGRLDNEKINKLKIIIREIKKNEREKR